MSIRFVSIGLVALLGLGIDWCEAQTLMGGKPAASIVVSPSATTIFASWTTDAPSRTTLSCGTAPGTYNVHAVDNGIQTNVRSHWAIVAGLAPSTNYYCQATAGVSRQFTIATIAIPKSTPLVSVTFGTPARAIEGQNFGDFYSNCISNDNIEYVATDDTQGWAGVPMFSNMSVNKFVSESPPRGVNVNGLKNFGYFGSCVPPDNRSPKIVGMYCDAGNIYIAYGRQYALNCSGFPPGGYPTMTGGNILKSADHGVSWSNFQAPFKYDENGAVPTPVTAGMFASGDLFNVPSFVGYGPDDGTLGYRVDNAEAYAYLIFSVGVFTGTDHLFLARIPRQSLPGLDRDAIEYYVGGADGSLDAAWSRSPAAVARLLTLSEQIYVPVLQYVPATGRYVLLLAWDTVVDVSTETTWEIYEAPHPWGPFTRINGPTKWKPEAFYNPVPSQRSVAGATPNGKPIILLMSGDYRNAAYYQLWTMPMVVNTH